MPRLLSLALCVVAWPALAQQYLEYPSMAECKARSAKQWQDICAQPGMRCGPGTTENWSCQPLNDGKSAALVIEDDRPDFAATHPKGVGLNAGEKAALQSKAAISPKLPVADVAADAAAEAPATDKGK